MSAICNQGHEYNPRWGCYICYRNLKATYYCYACGDYMSFDPVDDDTWYYVPNHTLNQMKVIYYHTSCVESRSFNNVFDLSSIYRDRFDTLKETVLFQHEDVIVRQMTKEDLSRIV